jgi:uncharacterized damage-inducible protein DinB
MNIDNIRWLYAINDNVFRVNTEGITHDESLKRPESGGNSINWATGHLLRSRQFLLKYLGTEWWLPKETEAAYQRGSSGEASPHFLSFEKEQELWNESQELLNEALTRLTPEQLLTEAPPLGDFARPDTLERRILFLHFHESYHLGQLGLMRRLLGKEGAIQ